MKFSTWLNGLTADASPDTAADYLVTYDASATGSKKLLLSVLLALATGSGIPNDGWVGAAAMTYAGADDPTYTLTISGDVTGTYQAGQRIKLTQATGGTKYFIITKAAYSAPDTTLTLYGGTDYDLVNEAISNPYYSPVKAPFGFPLDPTKWTLTATNISLGTQATPTQNVWYNTGTVSLAIHIGAWRVSYKAVVQVSESVAAAIDIFSTLSTANNSESDAEWTQSGATSSTLFRIPATVTKFLVLASKATYYLNIKTAQTGMDNIYIRGDIATTFIRAVSAYL